MLIKVHHNQNVFTVLEFSNYMYTLFDQKICIKNIWTGKIVRVPAVLTYRFVVNALTLCSTLLGNNFVKEKVYKNMLDFIVYFNHIPP